MNEDEIKKVWENQLTRRIDEMKKEYDDVLVELKVLSEVTIRVLHAREEIPYGEWLDMVTLCTNTYLRVTKLLENK